MVWRAIRLKVKAAAAVLVPSLLVIPSSGFSQRSQDAAMRQQELQIGEREQQVIGSIGRVQSRNAPPDFERLASDERQQVLEQLQEEIEAAELQDGPNSADLIAPLAALGRLHQQEGDHPYAAVAFQRALEIVRYTYGLHSLEQAPLLRQLIESMKAMGDAETAWNLEQDLLTLAERHPSDLRTARILRETADRRMDVLSRYNAGEWPPEIVLGCYHDEGLRLPNQHRSCASGSRSQVKRRLLFEAQTYYAQSINVILRNEQYGSDELPTLLMELAHGSYAYHTPELGRRSLHFLLALQTTNSEPWLARILTLVQIADWELLYSRGRNAAEEALAMYEEAYALLKEHRIAQSSVQEIFAPATPLVLPTFLPNPLGTKETQDAEGYIDVAFEISQYGEARKVDILDATRASTRADARNLVELILRSRFRPRLTNGRLADSEPIVLRYYLKE